MNVSELLIIAVSAILINNFVLIRFLGLCPYLGVSRRMDSALGMGLAVIFVMTLASAITQLIYHYLLDPSVHNLLGQLLGGAPPDLRFLRTPAFILVIASLVQFVEMVIRKLAPTLYNALGIYLPLITTNCAVFGVSILNVDLTYNFLESIVHGFASGIGFTLALLLMAGQRERFELARIPEPLKGLPIAMIMAGLMSIAFLGFSGLKLGG